MDSSNSNIGQTYELQLNEETDEISIKVKTIDSNEYLVNTNKDSSVSVLKQKIEEVKLIKIFSIELKKKEFVFAFNSNIIHLNFLLFFL